MLYIGNKSVWCMSAFGKDARKNKMNVVHAAITSAAV